MSSAVPLIRSADLAAAPYASAASSAQAGPVTAWDAIHAPFGPHDVPSTLRGVTVFGYDPQFAATVEDAR